MTKVSFWVPERNHHVQWCCLEVEIIYPDGFKLHKWSMDPATNSDFLHFSFIWMQPNTDLLCLLCKLSLVSLLQWFLPNEWMNWMNWQRQPVSGKYGIVKRTKCTKSDASRSQLCFYVCALSCFIDLYLMYLPTYFAPQPRTKRISHPRLRRWWLPQGAQRESMEHETTWTRLDEIGHERSGANRKICSASSAPKPSFWAPCPFAPGFPGFPT